ncbi:MAG: IS21 family transposase [Clostridium sp.]|uniref:IS21 family transposase n=1 Tax=Clostridium sp. TaxID=1506 RepID=UPI003D6C865B
MSSKSAAVGILKYPLQAPSKYHTLKVVDTEGDECERMLTMDKINYITAIREFEGLSLREICRRTGFHFRTVKKYVDKENWSQELVEPKQMESELDLLKPIINIWLENDLKIPRKQRHTAVRVFNRLMLEYPGELLVKQRTVTRYVSLKKKELYRQASDCSIYGSHPFGEAQLDFGEIHYYDKDGMFKKCYELVMSFPASNGAYIQLCRSQNQECLLESMQKIFEYMGGVPTRILFDNMSSAVTKILPEGKRKLVDQFSRFVLHHRFKASFCNPNSGNEKGNVEGKVGYARRNFMVPVPKIIDIDEYNKHLFKLCDEDMHREHYQKKGSINSLFYQDQQSFLELPKKKFKVCRLIKGKTDNYSFISFEKNKYSTSPKYTNCEVWIESTANYVRILDEKYLEIAKHERKYILMDSPVIDWLKYLPAIVKKPNALRYTDFFKTLPETWQDYFNKGDYSKNRKMLTIISPMIISGNLVDATAAIELALENGKDDADSFLACYRSITEPAINFPEVVTRNTPTQIPYIQDFSAYDQLMNIHVRSGN